MIRPIRVAIVVTAAALPKVLAFPLLLSPPFLVLSDCSHYCYYAHSNRLSRVALKSKRDVDDGFIETTTRRSNVEEEEGIRLNKVFKATHSRRAADKLIEEGRVTVNGDRVLEKGGYKVVPFRDVVALDGKLVKGWEEINAISRDDDHSQQNLQQRQLLLNNLQTSSFEYVKYYKPIGVTCTTDLRVRDNIIDSIHKDGYRSRHRVYPIGRLDKETSGLILLTNDGRIVNSVLRGDRKQPKVYKVKVDGLLEDHHLQRLRVRRNEGMA